MKKNASSTSTGYYKIFNQKSMRIYGGAPTHILETVLQYARNRGMEIIAVKSVKPSLEDAFVKITGLSPTIMAAEKGGGR